jgi:50S ribosomal subunit-associated GTPase HflX
MILRTLHKLGYRETNRFITHGPKPTCLLIHPVRTSQNREFEIWRAEEALRIIQACGWDAVDGLNEPRHGWPREKNSFGTEETSELVEIGIFDDINQPMTHTLTTNKTRVSAWSSAIVEKFHQFDCDDPAFLDPKMRRLYAESCVVRVRKVHESTFLDSGKTEELLVALGKAVVPPRYVVINAQLTPTQLLRLNVLASQAMLAWKSKRRGEVQAEARLKQLTGYLPEDEHEQYDFRTMNHVPEYIEVIDRNRLILEALYTQSKHRIVRGEYAGSSLNPGSVGSILKRQLELQKILWLSKNLIPANAASIDRRFTDALNQYVAGFKENITFGNIVIDAGQTRFGKSNRQYINDLVKFQLLRLKKKILKQKQHRENLMAVDNCLHIGLVGYANCGKTSLFNALVHQLAAVKRAKDNIVSNAQRRRLIGIATERPSLMIEPCQTTDAKQLDQVVDLGDVVPYSVVPSSPIFEGPAENFKHSNALTMLLAQAEVTESLDMPLETVEPRTAKIRLPSGIEVVIHDTPGFISDCPYFMFETFQGGFEFLRNCHVLLHVRDGSCPFNEQQADIVREALLMAGLDDADLKDVWTKGDLVRDTAKSDHLLVSGLTSDGLGDLIELIDSYSEKILRKRRFKLRFSCKDGPAVLRLVRECVHVVYDDSYEASESGDELSVDVLAGPNEEGRLRAKLLDLQLVSDISC